MPTTATATASEEPAWLQDGRKRIRRVWLWTILGVVFFGVATIGLSLLRTRWALVPAAGMALSQFGVGYAMVRQVMLAFRMKKEGVVMPRPALRQIVAMGCFAALSLGFGVLGLLQGQTTQAVYGFLGFASLLLALISVWRKQRLTPDAD